MREWCRREEGWSAIADALPIENLGAPSALDAIVAYLARAETSGSPPALDLTPLDRHGFEHRRTDVATVALLANLLVGRYSALPLEVAWPTEPAIDGSLQRGGLLFALVQRQGRTSWLGAAPDVLVWARDWRPREELLLDTSPDRVDGRTLAYVNTHRLGRGHFREYAEGAAVPWLGNLIPVPRNREVKERRDGFVLLAERAVIEVLENLPEHAFDMKRDLVGRQPWLEPPDEQGKSFLVCSLTRGGAGSYDRLHLLAVDNGFGIGRTLRWQHPDVAMPVDEVLETILRKQLHQRDIPGHNGIGLWWLHDIACSFGGEIEMITEDDLDASGDRSVSISMRYEDDSMRDEDELPREPPTHAAYAVPIRGTIIRAKLNVPNTVGEHFVRPLAHRAPAGASA